MSVLIDGMARVLMLRAEGGDIVISATGGMAAATTNARALDAWKFFDRPRDPMQVQHFYADLDSGTLDAVWIVGEIDAADRLSFLWGVADAVAASSGAETTYEAANSLAFANLYGTDAVKLLIDIVRDAATSGATREFKRWVRTIEDDDGEETGAEEYARLDIDDADWHDEGIWARSCAESDEGATLITMLSLDCGLVEGLTEMIEAKDRAAKAARRQPVGT